MTLTQTTALATLEKKWGRGGTQHKHTAQKCNGLQWPRDMNAKLLIHTMLSVKKNVQPNMAVIQHATFNGTEPMLRKGKVLHTNTVIYIHQEHWAQNDCQDKLFSLNVLCPERELLCKFIVESVSTPCSTNPFEIRDPQISNLFLHEWRWLLSLNCSPPY